MLLKILQHSKRRLLPLFAAASLLFAVLGYVVVRNITPQANQEDTSTQPATVIVPENPPLSPVSNAQTVLELFSPSDLDLSEQINETALSQQVEQIFVTSFVLTKCNYIDGDHYADTFRALIVYASRMGLAANSIAAEAKVRQLAESAGASYAMVYSRTKCDNPKLAPLSKQLLQWQKAYLND